MEEEIIFYGHPNVRALHPTTIEVTRDKNLTLRGDCIIGVSASKACSDLSDALKRYLRDEDSVVRLSVTVGGKSYEFGASGSPSLILADARAIVIRKSSFVCPRTLAVRSEAASNNLPRNMIRSLRDPARKGILLISTE